MRFQVSLNNKAIYHGLNDYLNVYDINTTNVGVYVWKFIHPHPLSNMHSKLGMIYRKRNTDSVIKMINVSLSMILC